MQYLSGALQPWRPGLLSLALYAAMVLILLVAMLFLAGWLGARRPNRDKSLVYESGIVPSSDARFPLPLPFYLVAVFFLVFDLEGAFIFAWAVAFETLGLWGWLRIAVFILVLLASLAYVWRKGGLDWGSSRPKNQPARRQPS